VPKRVPEIGVRVARVRPGGLAARAGLCPGDRLLRINGTPLRDLIDFHALAGEEQLRIDLQRGCQDHTLTLVREWGRELGLECEPPVPAEISTCANKCVFCFIHQLPRGLRKSLYVKDDDYRLSFLHGNYITLTDLPDAELDRIVEQHLSPLYISVHATDPALRHFLLGSPRTIRGDLMERMRRLAAAGIRMHAQIVLCPGLNDGEHLARTVGDLAGLHPGVTTVAVVPVGLTRHREGLYPLRSVTVDEARALLDAIHGWQADFRRRLETRLVYAADELYLLAGVDIPPAAAYEGFRVVEDGIGLVRRFEDAWRRGGPLGDGQGSRAPGGAPAPRRPEARISARRAVTVVTGELFAPVLRRLLGSPDGAASRVDVVAVPNVFFGPAISVAGLLTGEDVARALAGRPLGDVVPGIALQETRGVFLDDVSPDDLARHLGVPVEAPEATADGLRAALRRPGRVRARRA
jgi:putative radical SAM enzyme (TIGR03279 family)